jgi:hypothetical protein
MANQLLSAEKVDSFLGIESNEENYFFTDVIEDCKDIEDFQQNAELGQCLDLGGNEGYVYKIRDNEDNCYSVVLSGASLSNY